MATRKTGDFLTGVIEGFYGAPWAPAERLELFDWMADWGLNTYLYAPKDDLKHRAIWRQLYTQAEADRMAELIQACQKRQLRFIYALSPGLDIRYDEQSDLNALQERFTQLLRLGGRDFALLFDDIPARLDEQALKRWGSLAAAQCHVANVMFQWTRTRQPEAHFLFCPTPYCGRMAERNHGGSGYLAALGQGLHPEIDVFWTGPEIISEEISVAHIRELQAVLRRKPLIWDNLHANDYDGRRFFCGPYSGRSPALRNEVTGLLTNPNCEFPLNYVPLRTFAEFARGGENWEPRAAYLTALREWGKRFTLAGPPKTKPALEFEELLLFADCFYLPFADGEEAAAFWRDARELLTRPCSQWGAAAGTLRQRAAQLRATCARMSDLCERPLFHALSRRAWDLREELDLLERYIEFKSEPTHHDLPCRLDSHLPGTYRGGFTARLQSLLVLLPDGALVPANGADAGSQPPAELAPPPASLPRHPAPCSS